MMHRCGVLPEDLAAHFDIEVAVGRKVLAAAVQRGETDLGGVRGVKRAVLEQIESATSAAPLHIVQREPAPDGFVKYLFELHDGALVEAVRIPVPCEAPGVDTSAYEGKEKKYIVCVSSQVGCALACSFCATGQLGFSRNLTAAEIVGQVIAVRAERRRVASPPGGPEPKAEAWADRPVRGVVFMGMGEPFLNYDNVIKAARILCHPSGGCIDGRSITISTAGIVPQIRRFTEEGHKFRLAVSLTHAVPKKRLPLMPIEGVHPTSELVAALHDHARARRTRVLVEYVLLGGVNDSPQDARALAELLDRSLVKIDLIDVNPLPKRAEGAIARVDAEGTRRDTGSFRRATREARSAFLDVLAAARIPFAIRYSGGQEIAAGCGQLAAGQAAGSCGARML
jgi:23S rRNA (adenine2503-C2)-methyltransferase